jgi:uncharacterized membrane protein YphA (DoxX/SURF4 family)
MVVVGLKTRLAAAILANILLYVAVVALHALAWRAERLCFNVRLAIIQN